LSLPPRWIVRQHYIIENFMDDIQFKCPKCGSTEFKVPCKDFRDTDRIACAKCGFTDTYRRIVGPQVQKLVAEAMAKAFKCFR
jgi:ribosomal protein S27AE